MKNTAHNQNNETTVFAVDSHDSGLSIGRVPRGDCSIPALVLRDLAQVSSKVLLRRRYSYQKENPLWELERELMKLSRQGILGRSLIVFGVTTDPFFPFEGRFDCSMKALSLFERYKPAKLIIQTRSPLIVLNLPMLKRLGSSVSVTMPIESSNVEVITKYLPDVPRLEERLTAMTSLRRLGIHVTAQAFPILPYGDWHETKEYIKLLSNYGDSIITAPLITEIELKQRRVKKTLLLEALAKDRQFRYMRPDTNKALEQDLRIHCEAKLISPYDLVLEQRQMGWYEILSA